MSATEASADIIVIGLGAMGSSTVDAAATTGLSVIGLEAFAQGHANGSSHGPTRMLRRSVEEGPHYVPLVLDALPRWRQLAEDTAAPVIDLNGAIRIAPIGSPIHSAFAASAVAWNLEFDRLSASEVAQRFPGFAVPDDYEAMFEPEAGVLFAANAVRALQDRAVRHGATLHFGSPVLSWQPSGAGVEVRTADATYRAGRLVITAGAWTTRLAVDLGLPLVAHRVVNVSFEPLERSLFTADRLPAFIVSDGVDGVYGIPAVAGQGLKVGASGTPVDPDDVDREVHVDEIGRLRAVVDRFLPRASGAVSSTLTCLYTVAPDGEFVIDRHPAHPQVVVASPCSGHGFKYTTAIGPLLVDLATTGTTRLPIQSFAIDRFASRVER